MENTKMKKSAVVIDRILKILQRIAVACDIVFLIFIVLTLIFGEKIIDEVDSVSLGLLKVTLVEGTFRLNESAVKTGFIISLVLAAVSATICIYGLEVVRRVLAPMKEGRPFAEGISGTIRKLAWVVLVGGAVIQIGGGIAQIAEAKAYNLTALLAENVVAGYEYNFMSDGSFIVTAGVLFLLSYVFHYGEELQRESDETL